MSELKQNAPDTAPAAARRRGRRPGSVLILTVAVLVLLALMATAYISMVQQDRQQVTGSGGGVSGTGAAIQYDAATLDQALGAVVGAAKQAVIDDVAKGGFRTVNNPDYTHMDSGLSDIKVDNFIAARLPMGQPALPDAPMWSTISRWPTLATSFEDPLTQTRYPNITDPAQEPTVDPEGVARRWAAPDSVKIDYAIDAPIYPNPRTRVYPALQVLRHNGGATRVGPYVAGDTDGDGIADAGLFRIPALAGSDGATYFGAMRVVDNAAAVNVNTAFSRAGDYDFTLSPTDTNQNLPNFGFFRSNVGLVEMLDLSQRPLESGRLVTYRANNLKIAPKVPIDDQNKPRTDFEFLTQGQALESQVARRTARPGFVQGKNSYRVFPDDNGVALAYHFGLIDPTAQQSDAEKFLQYSLYQNGVNYPQSALLNPASRDKMFGYFPAVDLKYWYNYSFNPDDASRNSALTGWYPAVPPRPLRSQLVTSSAVSNQIQTPPISLLPVPNRSSANPPPIDKMPDYTVAPHNAAPAKTNINTATFGELWRAFYGVMFDANEPGKVPYKSATNTTDNVMFRPGILRGTNLVASQFQDSFNVLILRAALAAVNAIDMRDGDDDVTSFLITLEDPAGSGIFYNVRVFGNETQPFITEVFVDVDTAGTQYLAVELHNPHPTRSIHLEGWKLAWMNRAATPKTIRTIWDFGAADIIPPKGYLTIHNNPPPADVTPPTTQPMIDAATAQTGNDTLVTALTGELILTRPLRADGQFTLSINDALVENQVPVDQYDFTGLNVAGPGAGETVRRYLYSRPSGIGNEWKFVYPGKYDQVAPTTQPGIPRHQGTYVESPTVDPATAIKPTYNLGDGGTYSYTALNPIQLNNPGINGPFPIPQLWETNHRYRVDDVVFAGTSAYRCTSAHTSSNNPPPGANWTAVPNSINKFPHGGFARNGDILAVPFIGAYTVRRAGVAAIEEMNSITMDAYYAETAEPVNLPADATVNVGRFCPTGDPLATPPTGDYSPTATNWRYNWAMDIFDYLTVQAPGNDYTPDVDPLEYTGATPVANAPTSQPANAGNENLVPVEGLININTAPWQVLAMLPLVVNPADGKVDPTATETMAKAIVAYREGDPTTVPPTPARPFRSIFDLNRVPGFWTVNNTLPADPDDTLGDVSPPDMNFPKSTNASPTLDGVAAVNDFERRFLQMNRLSNLVTTRSDSFTCYVLVQGWNLAVTPPVLLSERREAFIIDRSTLTPSQVDVSKLRVLPVPTN